MENLIGKKIRGFKFISGIISYNSGEMDKYIGKVGEIICTSNEKVNIMYEDSNNWSYPIDQIQPHLIEEIPNLGVGTLMWVWDDWELDKRKRFVFGKNANGFYGWSNFEDKENINYNRITCWKNAEPITEPEYIHLTKQDICDGKGVGVNPSLIKIID